MVNLAELFEDTPNTRRLLSGNEAFARGIYEAGVKFAANYPGTPLSEVGDYLNYLSQTSKNFKFDYALNEKVALESAIGASWAGVRSVALFKHLGLNVAADPLHTFPYSGVNGGMIILCGGDPGILSSTNAQDNRLYSLHTKIPIIEPATVQECKDYIKEGLRLSELYNIPIYIHVTTRLCHSYGMVEYEEIEKPNNEGYFSRDTSRYINTLRKALNNQKNYFKTVADLTKNKKIFYLFDQVKQAIQNQQLDENNVGIITSGICYSYVIQACHKLTINPPILKLGLIFPINREEICQFADQYQLKKLLIVEELEPFIETFSKQVFCNFCDAHREVEIHGKDFLPNTGELSTDIIMSFFSQHFDVKNKYLLEDISMKETALEEILPTLPIREPTFCPSCQYRPVFYALKKVTDKFSKDHGVNFVFGGDIGCYTLAEAYPYQMIDWIVCMGAGVGISNGLGVVINPEKQKLIAFVGDSTFFHTGLQPVLNAIKNDLDILIFIFYNFWVAMTGHQGHIATPSDIMHQESTWKMDVNPIDLVHFIEGLGVKNLTVTDAYNIEKLERIFENNIEKKGIKIIIIKEECALAKKRRIRRTSESNIETYYKISESCVKCNECIEILGCPAINAEALDENEGLQYYIDETRCVPEICPGVCQKVCKNNAIFKTTIYHNLKKMKSNKNLS